MRRLVVLSEILNLCRAKVALRAGVMTGLPRFARNDKVRLERHWPINRSNPSLRGAVGDVAIQWISLSVRNSKTALRAGFMTGLLRAARNDARSESVELRLSNCHSCL